jgi:hypothetical protein
MGQGQSHIPDAGILVRKVTQVMGFKREITSLNCKENPKSNLVKPRDLVDYYGKKKHKQKKCEKALEEVVVELRPFQQHMSISLDQKLLCAKFANFENSDFCFAFGDSLKRMILNTRQAAVTIQYQKRNLKSYHLEQTEQNYLSAVCKFLQILVTPDEQCYLIPLPQVPVGGSDDWTDSLFNDTFTKNDAEKKNILTQIVLMVLRQKRLINTEQSLMFNVDFYINRKARSVNAGWHRDFKGNPEYTSVTLISRNPALSTEIKMNNSKDSFTFLNNPGTTVMIDNHNLEHRTPDSRIVEHIANNINVDRTGIRHQTMLTEEDLMNPDIVRLNEATRTSYEARDLLRICAEEVHLGEDAINYKDEISEQLMIRGSDIYTSNMTKYSFSVVEGETQSEHYENALLGSLPPHSIGGKSKNKKRNKTRNKKRNKTRNKTRNKKRAQRGGGIPENFAIYADYNAVEFVKNNFTVKQYIDQNSLLTYE